MENKRNIKSHKKGQNCTLIWPQNIVTDLVVPNCTAMNFFEKYARIPTAEMGIENR